MCIESFHNFRTERLSDMATISSHPVISTGELNRMNAVQCHTKYLPRMLNFSSLGTRPAQWWCWHYSCKKTMMMISFIKCWLVRSFAYCSFNSNSIAALPNYVGRLLLGHNCTERMFRQRLFDPGNLQCWDDVSTKSGSRKATPMTVSWKKAFLGFPMEQRVEHVILGKVSEKFKQKRYLTYYNDFNGCIVWHTGCQFQETG